MTIFRSVSVQNTPNKGSEYGKYFSNGRLCDCANDEANLIELIYVGRRVLRDDLSCRRVVIGSLVRPRAASPSPRADEDVAAATNSVLIWLSIRRIDLASKAVGGSALTWTGCNSTERERERVRTKSNDRPAAIAKSCPRSFRVTGFYWFRLISSSFIMKRRR